MRTVYQVNIIESERGWGQKVDETIYFSTDVKAKTYVQEYNNKYNPPGPAPDWYMIAEYAGPTIVPDMSDIR
jgi:hypothetical protein